MQASRPLAGRARAAETLGRAPATVVGGPESLIVPKPERTIPGEEIAKLAAGNMGPRGTPVRAGRAQGERDGGSARSRPRSPRTMQGHGRGPGSRRHAAGVVGLVALAAGKDARMAKIEGAMGEGGRKGVDEGVRKTMIAEDTAAALADAAAERPGAAACMGRCVPLSSGFHDAAAERPGAAACPAWSVGRARARGSWPRRRRPGPRPRRRRPLSRPVPPAADDAQGMHTHRVRRTQRVGMWAVLPRAQTRSQALPRHGRGRVLDGRPSDTPPLPLPRAAAPAPCASSVPAPAEAKKARQMRPRAQARPSTPAPPCWGAWRPAPTRQGPRTAAAAAWPALRGTTGHRRDSASPQLAAGRSGQHAAPGSIDARAGLDTAGQRPKRLPRPGLAAADQCRLAILIYRCGAPGSAYVTQKRRRR